jgi:hypothetical protein
MSYEENDRLAAMERAIAELEKRVQDGEDELALELAELRAKVAQHDVELLPPWKRRSVKNA